MNSTARSNDKNLEHVLAQKFESPYACIFMDEEETEFLKRQELQPFVCFPYTDDTFFIWTDGEEKLTHFLNKINNFHSNLKFTCETSSCTLNFVDLNVSLRDDAIHIDPFIKPTKGHQYLHYISLLTPYTLRPQYHIVKY